MLDDDELKNESSVFYKKPEEYSLKKLSFYMCKSCKKPYYAGLASCGEEKDGELLCSIILLY